MTLRAAKWTAMLTRATQTLDRGYVSMDLPPTQLRGLWALTQSCARACVSRVRAGWFCSKTVEKYFSRPNFVV